MAKVFPLSDTLQFKVDPQLYRMAVGTVELVCGIMLAMIPGCVRELANVVLLIIMAGAAYSHHAVGDDVEKMMPAVVCGALLALRLLARRLTCSRDKVRYQKSQAGDDHSKTD